MTAGPGLMPWRLTAVGVVLVLLTALVGGFLLAYWAGGSRRVALPIAPSPPVASAPAASPAVKAAAPPAPATAPKVAPAPAPSPPPKVAPAPAATPKIAAAPVPVPAPQPAPPAPAPASVKRTRPESTPAPAVKPRTAPAVPSQADVDACARYATVQAEEHDKAAEDDQDRKSDEAYQKAYASCMQARGFKKARSDD